MIDTWFKQDVEHQLSRGNRVVILDPHGQCGFLLSLLTNSGYVIIKTDSKLTEHWQIVKEELLLRHQAEVSHKSEPVIFYVTREKGKLSFLFDYCSTHGCLDLSKPNEWLKQKLFAYIGIQIQMENPLLLTAAKLGLGKDITWWKKILQNLDDMINIEAELLPFLDSPAGYLNSKEPDILRLFEEKFFEILGQPYIPKPPETLASEIVKRLLDGLAYNELSPVLLAAYYRWADSDRYRPSLLQYISSYKIDDSCNPWAAHPDHCFEELDKKALRQLTANMHDKSFLADKMPKIRTRSEGLKAKFFVPSWWQDFINLVDFNNKDLSFCNSFDKVIEYYTDSFFGLDRAMRHLYVTFLQEEQVIRPLQERYESLNHELLQQWFAYEKEYEQNQQGYLVDLLKTSKPGIAVIVGDGIRYEIAEMVSTSLSKNFNVERKTMLADLPSETEHNMSALYSNSNEIIPLHKDREKKLVEATGKEITFLDLEALTHGIKADYLVLTYKDIDDAGEKLQHGALKLIGEFEKVLQDKIMLLMNMGFREVHLTTDHGFVLTGLLDEADKIEPIVSGKKAIHERYIRCENKQTNADWIELQQKYGEFNYVYIARNHRPFKSKGTYGYSHGGFTPQEIIIPAFVFSQKKTKAPSLEVAIINKNDLKSVTGNNFSIKVQASASAPDLFSSSRKVQIMLFAGSTSYSCGNIVTMAPGECVVLEFSFGGHKAVRAVLLDADTQEQIDSASIEKSNVRDVGGLL